MPIETAARDRVVAELEVLHAEYEAKLAAIAARIRISHVIPYCDKNGCAFAVCNGDWWFTGEGWHNECRDDKVAELLGLEPHVYCMYSLGELIEAYDPNEPKENGK